MLKLAQLYDERGETDNALANLDACTKHNPDSAEFYLYYGTMLRRKGRLNEAQKAFEKALEINKFMSKAFYQLGLLEKAKIIQKVPRNSSRKQFSCLQMTHMLTISLV